MVAGQHTQTAGINGQSFPDAVFHGEIGRQHIPLFFFVFFIPGMGIVFIIVIGFFYLVDLFTKAVSRLSSSRRFCGTLPSIHLGLRREAVQSLGSICTNSRMAGQFQVNHMSLASSSQKFNIVGQIGLHGKRMDFHVFSLNKIVPFHYIKLRPRTCV